jgi:excisionase family DNA binding protein
LRCSGARTQGAPIGLKSLQAGNTYATTIGRLTREEGNGMDRLLTVKEASELLACSKAAIRKWIYQRRLPRVKVGRLTRLRQRDVEALVTKGLGSTLQVL